MAVPVLLYEGPAAVKAVASLTVVDAMSAPQLEAVGLLLLSPL